MPNRILAAMLAVVMSAPFWIAQARANDGQRIFNAIIGTGTQLLLNEQRRAREAPTMERRRGDDPSARAQGGDLNRRQMSEAQSRLNAMGYDAGEPDGVPGSRTREAIRQFQQDNGMRVTGALTLGQFSVLTESVQAATTSPEDRPLSRGEMADVQRALSALGFNVGKADGVAGSATGRAISDFLRERGLDPYQTPVREAQRLILAEAGRPAEAAPAATRAASGQMVQAEAVPGNDLLSRIGMTFRGADVLTGSTVIGIDSFAKGMERLARLLILKAQPHLLDERGGTLFFARALEPQEGEQFADLKPFGGWKGANEFQQEDNRKAFLARYREKLLSMRPSLPIDFADMHTIRLGKYDAARQALEVEISRYSPWPDLSDRRLEAPYPYAIPTHWPLGPDEARRIVEALAEGKEPRDATNGIALLRYRARDVRAKDGGAILDLVALDITIYSDRKLSRPLATMPLPADAVVEADTADREVAYLDTTYASVVAAGLMPSLLESESFLKEAYRLRRASERMTRRGYRYNGIASVAAWPMIVPAALLDSQIEPNAADIAKMRGWLAENSAQMGDIVRLPGICMYFNARQGQLGDCLVRSMQGVPNAIDLAQLMTFREYDWSHAAAFHDERDDMLRAARRHAPDAVALNLLPSGRQIPTVVALEPHTAWFGAAIDADPDHLADASFDLTVTGKAFHKDGQGRDFLLISVTPKTLSYTPAGGQRRDIDMSAPSTGPAAATYDILGAKVGMSFAEAEAALKVALPLDSFKRVSGRVGEGRLGAFVRWERAEGNGPVSEIVVLYFDDREASQPVVAAGRMLKLGPDGRAAAEAGLNAKYGAPDGTNSIDDRRYWAADRVMKARLAAGMGYDDACGHNSSRGFFEASENYRFADVFLSRRCGEVLSAWLIDSEVSVLLTHSDRIIDIADARRAAEAAAEAKKKNEVPAIKF